MHYATEIPHQLVTEKLFAKVSNLQLEGKSVILWTNSDKTTVNGFVTSSSKKENKLIKF